MTKIEIYDYEAEQINQICEKNDISPAYFLELLMQNVEDVIEENGLG